MTEVIEKTENKKGYKKTKLGWIPEDWKMVCFNELFDEVVNLSNDTETYPLYSLTLENGVTPKTERYERSHLLKDKNENEFKLISEGEIAINPMNLRFGAFFMSKVPETVSLSAYYDIVKAKKDTVNVIFYDAFMKSASARRLYQRIATGSLDEKKRIHLSELKKQLVPYPKKEEQDKIAEILSAWDDGIETLEKLIEVKKHYLRNIAKKLLSNKTKSSEWSEFSLGSISINLNKKVCEKKLPVLSITAGTGFVLQSDKFGKNIAGNQYKNYTLLRKNEFSYNKGNSKKYAQGCVYCLKNYEEAAVPNVFISFKLNNEIALNEYFEQLFKYNYHGSKLKKYINSGVRDDGLLNLNSNNFFKIKFKIPQIEEQQKIVDVLNSYDREIELLNLKLEKLKEQKKGLMQKLLTGQMRVKV